jgi:hypothetical protein
MQQLIPISTRLPRREFLRASAAGTAALAAAAFTLRAAEPEPQSAAAIRALYESLTNEQRGAMCYAWDHVGFTKLPLRLHVTNNWEISPVSLRSFSAEQQRHIDAILTSVLSDGWPEKIKQQAHDDTGQGWGNQKIALFGNPERGPCQCVITGFHLTLRATCEPTPGVAFHGAICHGHQPSGFDEKVRHPNNIFWYQAELANKVFQMLDGQQRDRALVRSGMPFYLSGGQIDRQIIRPDSKLSHPLEPDVRFQGSRGKFPGLSIAELTGEQRTALDLTLDGMLGPYRTTYQSSVRDCLRKQGGLEACSLAFYAEHDLGADEEWDNWRIEGPAFVWYFRGFPHVHIWIHAAEDPDTPVTSHFG